MKREHSELQVFIFTDLEVATALHDYAVKSGHLPAREFQRDDWKVVKFQEELQIRVEVLTHEGDK